MQCPFHKCDQAVSEEMLQKIGVDRALIRAWRRELARHFVAKSEGGGAGTGSRSDGGGVRIVHCKNSRCQAVIRLPPGSSSAVTCGECGHGFCSMCDFPAPHAPATCEMVSKWQDKGGMVEASQEDLRNWLEIQKVSKRCPKCGHAIIKEPGTCNHMTCDPRYSGCGHHFCCEYRHLISFHFISSHLISYSYPSP